MKRTILVEIETSADGLYCHGERYCPLYRYLNCDYSECAAFGGLEPDRSVDRKFRHPRCREQPIDLHFTGQERLAPDTVYVTAVFRKVDP